MNDYKTSAIMHLRIDRTLDRPLDDQLLDQLDTTMHTPHQIRVLTPVSRALWSLKSSLIISLRDFSHAGTRYPNGFN